MKNGRKTVWRILGFCFLALFFLLNTVAYLHAYKFTHYGEPGTVRTKIDSLSGAEKIGVILTGITNPKPQNDSLPHVPYQTLKMGSDRVLEGWLLEAPENKGTVAVFHGYSSNKSRFVPHAEIIQSLGWNVLLVDFYGCGGSDGYESTIGYKEAWDVKTVFDHLKSRSDKPVVLYGCSMGAAAVMKAMADGTVQPDKIVLECPFGSMRSAVDVRVGTMGAPRFPFTDLFMLWGAAQNDFWTYGHNPEEYAGHISCPALLLYGEKDNRVPRAETDRIYQNLAGPKRLVTFPESGHESYLKQYTLEWTEAVGTFLAGK